MVFAFSLNMQGIAIASAQQQRQTANCLSRCDHHSSSSSSSCSISPFSVCQCPPSQPNIERVKQRQPSGGNRFLVQRVDTQLQLTEFAQKQEEQEQIGRAEGGNKEKQSNRGNWPHQHQRGEHRRGQQQQSSAPADNPEFVTFRYTWPVRISERLIGAGESAILNVSPPFCTAYNGVQFTWLLRICEENILDIGSTSNESTLSGTFQQQMGIDPTELANGSRARKKVNITLYYKEGPARDVKLRGGSISIRNSDGILFDNMGLRDLEYTKGGGWSPICGGGEGCLNSLQLSAEQRKFCEFIYAHVGKQITVRVQLKMPASLFQPMQYLPSIDSPIGDKLEALCARVLDEIRLNQLRVPDVQFFDPSADKYALYRHVFLFACQEIFNRFVENDSSQSPINRETDDETPEKSPELMEKIRNIFAHYYFNTVIVREAECFEDFLEALDASRHVQFPALRRECERYICAEVMAEFADLMLVKKMLLLAERFDLSVLKMVSFGVIVDRLLLQQQRQMSKSGNTNEKDGDKNNEIWQRQRGGGNSGANIQSMEEIREELLEIAEQIINNPENQQAFHHVPGGGHQIHHQRRMHSKSLCSSVGSAGSGSPTECYSDSDEEGDDEEEDAESDPGRETLVGSVVTQLEELARHIRKVSMPPGVSPAPAQLGGRPLSPAEAQDSPFHSASSDSGMGSVDSRRSSLKTTREVLLLQQQGCRPPTSTERSCSCIGTYCPAGDNTSSIAAGQQQQQGVAHQPGSGSNTFFAQIYRRSAADEPTVGSSCTNEFSGKQRHEGVPSADHSNSSPLVRKSVQFVTSIKVLSTSSRSTSSCAANDGEKGDQQQEEQQRKQLACGIGQQTATAAALGLACSKLYNRRKDGQCQPHQMEGVDLEDAGVDLGQRGCR